MLFVLTAHQHESLFRSHLRRLKFAHGQFGEARFGGRIVAGIEAGSSAVVRTALEDRGHLLLFEPTPLEVHRQAARWFWHQEIFDFIADHLHLMAQHSLSTYCYAWELKQAGLDWRQGVLCRCLIGAALAVAKLKANPNFASEAERVRTFVQSGAGCRATYFRHAQKLQAVAKQPKITLSQMSPPVEEVSPGTHLDQLRRRFGRLGNG